MEDSQIVDLYWARSEKAISETADKYGGYCYSIAFNILHSHEDCEECVNDTYLKAWNAMPEARPDRLRAFLGRITRNLSLKRWEEAHAQKRGAGQLPLALDELQACIPEGESPDRMVDDMALADLLNRFLASMSAEKRKIFMRRYWYFSPITDIDDVFIGKKLGKGEGIGYDIYEDQNYSQAFDLWQIKGVSEKYMVAAEMDGQFYSYRLDEYIPPATFADVLDDYSLSQTLSLHYFIEYKDDRQVGYYSLKEDGYIWQLLSACRGRRLWKIRPGEKKERTELYSRPLRSLWAFINAAFMYRRTGISAPMFLTTFIHLKLARKRRRTS